MLASTNPTGLPSSNATRPDCNPPVVAEVLYSTARVLIARSEPHAAFQIDAATEGAIAPKGSSFIAHSPLRL